MSAFLNLLKSIIPDNFTLIIKDLFNKKVITTNNYYININDTENLNLLEKETIKEIAHKSFENPDVEYLLERPSQNLTLDYKKNESDINQNEIILILQDVIPPEDIDILRISLYLRKQFENSRSEFTSKLKQDILNRYGKRGNNISNLCSQHYFEDYIVPLYNELRSAADFNKEEFLKFYNELIMNFPLAIFVNKNKSAEQLKEEILEKYERNKQYGISFLFIHGIGRTNITNIRNAIDVLKEELTFQNKIEETSISINVRLEFSD